MNRINKIVSIILILSLILSLFTADVVADGAQSSKTVWNGLTSAPVADSEGVYQIGTAEELAYIISTGGGEGNNYRLTADIYLNETDKVNWTTGEPVNGYSPRPWYDTTEFQGNIDGNGHIVYGIYYNAGLDTSEMVEGWNNPVGLIPCIKNGTTVKIEKLGIDNMYINAKCTASAFIGRAGNSSATTEESRSRIYIDNCFVGENVNVTAFCAGVFRGYSRKSAIHISNSYNLGYFRSNCDKKNDIDGGTYDYRFSWFVGNTWGLGATAEDFSFTACYNATGALLKGHFGTYNPLIVGCYAAGLTHDKNGDGVAEEVWYSDAGNAPLTKEYMQGEDALESIYKMPYLNTLDAYLATEGYPVLKAFIKDYKGDGVTEAKNQKAWDGSIADSLVGEGTEESPYLISNGSELALAITGGGSADKFYKLTNDIYLNDINKVNWTIGKAEGSYRINSWFDNAAFSGNIDGDGYVVYGLYYKTKDTNLTWGYWGEGLIPRVNVGDSVKITSLGIDYAYVCGVNGASAFVGFAGNTEYTEDTSVKANVTIDRCFVGSKVFLMGNDAGAFRGGTYNSVTTIKNSYSLATLRGTATAGLVGNIWESTVSAEDSFNTMGAVTTDVYNWNDVGQNLENVYVTDAANYQSEVNTLTIEQMLDGEMSLPSDVFVPIQTGLPLIKDFFKFSDFVSGKDYVGYTYSQYAKLFTSVDNSSHFWRFDTIDVTGEGDMNICDLVYATKKESNGKNTFDIDADKETTAFDITVLRNALIGNTDYEQKPQRYTPAYNNISDKYEYVWGDEFSDTYLDGNKWAISAKMGSNPSKGFYNDEDEKVINVENGSLRLTAYKADDGTYHVPTSVITRNSMNFTYGYVEIRAKLPLQTGVWSSFWALTVADSASVERLAVPKCSSAAEIDMFEVFGTNQISGGIIKWASPGWYPRSTDGLQRVALEQDNEYHIFGYEWTPTEIAMYCDGVMYARFDITESWTNPGEYGKGKEGWTYYNADETGTDMSCFNDPQYLIFNNHLFYEGVSNANQYINISNPDFKSADYLIDYCRVYQISAGSELYTK